MKFNSELFSHPNAAQQQLMNVVDMMIDLGETRDHIHLEIDRLYDDPAIFYFLRSYLSWRLPEESHAEGFEVFVGIDKSAREGIVLEQVRSVAYEKGLYVHVDLVYPEAVDEDIDLKIEVSLSGCEEKRITGWDYELIDIFHEGDRLHMYPFLLSDLVGEEGLAADEERTLLITVLKNDETLLLRTVRVRGSDRSKPRAEAAARQTPSVEERLAALDRHPGLEAFRERALDLVARFRVAEARKGAGLAPNPPVLHTALVGNPGTEKAACIDFLKGICKDFGYLKEGKVKTVRLASLVTAIRSEAFDNMLNAVADARGGTLVFEDAHELARAAGVPYESEHYVIRALIDTLSDPERYPDWMLVLCGEPDGMDTLFASYPELRNLMSAPIRLRDLSLDELYKEIDSCCESKGLSLDEEARRKVESYIAHLYSHRGPGFDNARMVRRVFDELVIPAMYRRLGAVAEPDAEALRTVLGTDVPTAVAAGEAGLRELESLVGLGKIKSRLKDYLFAVRLAARRMELGLPTNTPSLHMAFLGNPGTGKTTVAEIIGRVFASWGILSGGRVIRTEKSRMVGQYVGETEHKMNRLLAGARGNILFIDEAYQLVEGGNNDYGRIVMNSLLTELGKENPDMIVILAGYTAPMKKLLESNEGIESRFPNVFSFEDYTTDELLEIGKQMIAKQGFVLTPGAEANMRAVIQDGADRPSPRFGNGRFVSNLIRNDILASLGARTSSLENPTKEELSTILPEDVIVGKARKAVVFDDDAIDEALARLDALSGIQNVKEAIHHFVRSARYLHSIGEPYVGKGLLAWRFIGRSGTGKSTVAEIMAAILKGMRLISNSHITQVKGERLFNVSETVFDAVLREAVKKSCNGLIFIDADDPQFADTRFNYGRSVEQIRLKVKELTVEVGGECALVLAELDAPNKNVAEQLSEGGVYEFDHTLIFKDFTPDELFGVLCHCLQRFEVTFTPPAEKHMRAYLAALEGSAEANARTMKLMARTIYQQVILRESGLTRPPKTHQVQLADIATFRWNGRKGKIGF